MGRKLLEKAFDVTVCIPGRIRYWDRTYEEYIFYDPDKDNIGEVYLTTADTSNTANDALDGIWGTIGNT